VNATPDLHGCITTAYFRKEPFVSELIAGKYISYHYDFKLKQSNVSPIYTSVL
jgi:predicted metal-dependent hydrolase